MDLIKSKEVEDNTVVVAASSLFGQSENKSAQLMLLTAVDKQVI